MEDKKEITKEGIDKLLKLLPILEKGAKVYELGEISSKLPDGTTSLNLDPYNYSEDVSRFMDTFYSENFTLPDFDWGEWQEEAEKYFDNPELLKNADLTILRQLLVLHIRKDRFCSGHFAMMLEEGHILAILKRLSEIRKEMK